MKALWISLNLTGAALIIGGAIYTMNHKSSFPIVLMGMCLLAISNFVRLRMFSNK